MHFDVYFYKEYGRRCTQYSQYPKRKCHQDDWPDLHWGSWRLSSTSPVRTRAVILIFPFEWRWKFHYHMLLWRQALGMYSRMYKLLLFETQILVLISIKMLDISNFSRSLEEAICNNFFRTTHKVLLEHDHCKCFHFFSVVTFIFVVCVTVTDTKPIEDSWARGSYQW